MKLEDIPTAIRVVQISMITLLKLQEKYDLAVAALRKIEINDDCYESAPIAKEALAQIEEGK
jgi:hypothetical protein